MRLQTALKLCGGTLERQNWTLVTREVMRSTGTPSAVAALNTLAPVAASTQRGASCRHKPFCRRQCRLRKANAPLSWPVKRADRPYEGRGRWTGTAR